VQLRERTHLTSRPSDIVHTPLATSINAPLKSEPVFLNAHSSEAGPDYIVCRFDQKLGVIIPCTFTYCQKVRNLEPRRDRRQVRSCKISDQNQHFPKKRREGVFQQSEPKRESRDEVLNFKKKSGVTETIKEYQYLQSRNILNSRCCHSPVLLSSSY